jgi:hypothetical protein
MRSSRPSCLIATILIAFPGPAVAQQGEPGVFVRTGTFASPRISESSGVAVSRRHPGIVWTHNDSGHDPLLYATNLKGEDLGTFRVSGARAVDWEDLALAPCPRDDTPCLYIADTGDNLERRKWVTIYIVPEPESLPEKPATGKTQPARALTVTYPDGSHDVEALAVAPDREISLITRGRGGVIQRYLIPPPWVEYDSVAAQRAETLAVLRGLAPLRQATGAAFSRDGRLLAVRTYTRIIFFLRGADGRLSSGGPACILGLREPQGEGVDFLDDGSLVLTSEAAFGRPGGIATLKCPPAAPRE